MRYEKKMKVFFKKGEWPLFPMPLFLFPFPFQSVLLNSSALSPNFFLRDSRASETRARVKITPRRLAFPAWGDFHAH